MKKKIIVTGGLGFIGSHLIKLLIKKGYFVINVDKITYSSNKKNLKKFKSTEYLFCRGDINNQKLIVKLLLSYKPRAIFNLAAETHVDRSIDSPEVFIKSNIFGVYNILEATKKYLKINKDKNFKFIHISTDEVYGDIKKNKFSRESDAYNPSSPYASSKASADLIIKSYFRTYNLPAIITNCSNNYGPNQYPEKLIPLFIQQLKNNEKVTIQGDGTAVRAFLHALDTATAFETILEKGKIGEIYNIGCDEHMEYSVMDVAKILIEKIQKTTDYNKWISYIEDRPFNDQRYYISNKKVKDLGWNIKINFNDGINDLC